MVETAGFLVLGPDYLQGDYFQHHENEEGWDRKMWLQSSMKQALVITPTWVEAAKSKYGVSHCHENYYCC